MNAGCSVKKKSGYPHWLDWGAVYLAAMTVTITSLRLRHFWGFFLLSAYAYRIVSQMKVAPGLLSFRKSGLGMVHYTCSGWASADSARKFASSGAHLKAMKQSSRIATEIRTYTYETDSMPPWPEAKKLLSEKGKVFRYSKS